MKFDILFGVQHFQQGGSGITVKIFRNLVNFIQDEDRICRSGLDQILDDPARHGTNVGFSVSANFRLIVQSAKTHPNVLTTQCIGDRPSQGSFPDSWRTIQTDDRRFHVALQFQHGQMFQDALLDIVQSEMVFVKYLLCIFQVKIIFRIEVPGQIEQSVEVPDLHGIFAGRRIHSGQFPKLLFKNLLNIFFPQFLGGTLFQLFNLLLNRTSAQFILDGLDLLMKQVFALLLIQVNFHLLLNVFLQFEHLHLPHQQGEQFCAPVLDVVAFQQLLLFGGVEFRVVTDKIDQKGDILNVPDGKLSLLGYIGRGFCNFQ